jgi:hypothetical protein
VKKIDLGQAISILANAGVIAGIVFLALELRQNNELLAAEGRINRANQIRETWNGVTNHPEMAPLFVKDRNGEALTEAEEVLLNAYWMSTLIGLQWQFQEGLAGAALNGMSRNFESYGSLRRTWQGNSVGSRAAGKDNFDDDFVEYLETNIPELSRLLN